MKREEQLALKKAEYEGSVFKTNNYGDVIVLEYNNVWDVTIKFLNTGNVRKTATSELRKGKIRDNEAFPVHKVCIMDIPKSIDVIDDKEVISLVNKLNNLFHLSKSTVGLASPMIIHHLVWHDLFKETLIFTRTKLEITSLADLSKHKLNTVEKRIVANKVLDSIPKWLRYNSRNKMRADLITLFDNVEDFVTA